MREIKFRAWDEQGNKWVGSYIYASDYDEHEIYVDEKVVPIILPETLGQFTGLKDVNGQEIWEGDLVRDKDGRVLEVKLGVFNAGDMETADTYYGAYTTDESWSAPLGRRREWKVVGNIHENPELLELA